MLVAFPLAAGLLGSVVVLALHRRIGPRFGAFTLAVTAVAFTGGLTATAGFYAMASVVPVDDRGWCGTLLGHGVHPHPMVGAAAAAVALVVMARAALWWLRYRRTLAKLTASSNAALVVLDEGEPVAFACPVGSGSVVVSRGLMARLTLSERLVVLAHERAHLDLHHSRYVVAAGLTAAGCPFVAPLARATRWCTERAADEAAAMIIGDRRLVADAITKAASATAPVGLAGISGAAVVSRVEALLAQPPRVSLSRTVAALAAMTFALAGTVAQIHHLVEVAINLG
jgi:Zn-dependent protease with chaperone function